MRGRWVHRSVHSVEVARAARWRGLGRYLPKEVRERVYDPAFTDLLYRWLTSGEDSKRIPFGVYAIGTVLGCIPIAVPRLFFRRGALTRLSRVVLASAATLLLALFLLSRFTGGYIGY